MRKARLFNNAISISKEEDMRSTQQNKNIALNRHCAYFDCMAFDMISAGSSLKVAIFSLSFIGSKPELIG